MIAAIGAAVVVVALTVMAIVTTSPRWGSFTRHDPAGRSEGRFAWWALQMLDGFGYTFPRPNSLMLPTEVNRPRQTEWLSAQLVLLSTQDTSLVLDCLVLPKDVDGLEGWFGGAPVTLRAHPTARLTPIADVDRAVARWIQTGITVNIAMGEEDGVPTLQIADDDALVTLELDAASA